MKVTRVHYFLFERDTNRAPLANCFVVLDNCLKLDGIKLYDGSKGKYIVYPEKEKDKLKGEGRDRKNEYFNPLEKEFAMYLENVIIDGYRALMETGNLSYVPKEKDS